MWVKHEQKKKLSGDVVTMMNKTKCVAEGYKLIQMDLLQKCLQRAVICKNCFSRRSKMELFHNPGSKKGLAEELIFKCNMCHHESKFMTSSKCTVNKKNQLMHITLMLDRHMLHNTWVFVDLKNFVAC